MEWSNKIGVFTKTQGTKQQAIQKTPLVFMIYLPLIKSGPVGSLSNLFIKYHNLSNIRLLNSYI